MTTTLGGRSTRNRGETHADATETTKEAVTSIEEKANVNTKRSNAATTVGESIDSEQIDSSAKPGAGARRVRSRAQNYATKMRSGVTKRMCTKRSRGDKQDRSNRER